MANYFLDNEDIQFLFDHIDLAELASVQEDGFAHVGQDTSGYAPRDAADAVDNYRRVLEIIGEVAGDMIAPNAEQVDHEGNTLNDDGTVTLHPLVQKNLDRLNQADLMGFTLPRKYGGLNCPSLDLHHGHRNRQPGRYLADEHVRAARHRRDDPRLCQRRDQGRSAAAVHARRSDRRDGAHRARRRQRPAGRASPRLPGRAGQLVSQRREAIHHQRLRRDPLGAWPAASRKSATAAA